MVGTREKGGKKEKKKDRGGGDTHNVTGNCGCCGCCCWVTGAGIPTYGEQQQHGTALILARHDGMAEEHSIA